MSGNDEHIRKEVGTPPKERPLERAWRMRNMLIALHGEPDDSDDPWIRKRVGPKYASSPQDHSAGPESDQ